MPEEIKTEKPKKTEKKKPVQAVATKRTIRRAVDVRNSELRDIAAILKIRSPLPRSKKQREDLLMRIRNRLR
jgi:hypothetical protein